MPSTPAFPDYSPVSWTTARVVLWFLFATSLFFAFFSFVQGVVDAGLVMLAFASAAFALASLIGRRARRVRFDEENAALIFTRGAKTTVSVKVVVG